MLRSPEKRAIREIEGKRRTTCTDILLVPSILNFSSNLLPIWSILNQLAIERQAVELVAGRGAMRAKCGPWTNPWQTSWMDCCDTCICFLIPWYVEYISPDLVSGLPGCVIIYGQNTGRIQQEWVKWIELHSYRWTRIQTELGNYPWAGYGWVTLSSMSVPSEGEGLFDLCYCQVRTCKLTG